MRLQGHLDRDALPNLLQYLGMSNASGVLRVRSAGLPGDIHLERGSVVHAAVDGYSGTEALRRLLRLERGTFWFETGTAPTVRTISTPLNAILLELAYETDVERRETDTAVPALTGDTILEPVPAAGDGRRRTGNLTLPLTAIRALPLLGEGLRLREMAARLGVELPEMLAAADVTVRSGLAEIQVPSDVDPAVIRDVTAVLRDIMGPLAEIVLDEVLFELDLDAGAVPEARLPELLEHLAAAADAERPGVRQMFWERIRHLGRRTGARSGS